MATDELISKLDYGPKTLRLQRLLSETDDKTTLLSFTQVKEELRLNARTLAYLIEQYNEKALSNKSVDKMLVATSVAQWIFYTNKIEQTGLPSEGETFDLLKSGNAKTKEDKEVMQTFELLKTTYKPSDLNTNDARVFFLDSVTIRKWHTILLGEIESHAGKFRTHGSEATTTDLIGDKHKYPHHALVRSNTENLCKCICLLLKHIGTKYNELHSRVLYVFALAAFAQFHFVDIHPFSDGNGRICGFLSKRILDWVCPVPFPQFPDRNVYLRTLDTCRMEMDYLKAPLPLFNLLMKTAIDYYQMLLDKISNIHPTVLCVMTADELIEELPKSVDETEREDIVQKFRELQPDKSLDYCLKEGTPLHIIRAPVVDFDSSEVI